MSNLHQISRREFLKAMGAAATAALGACTPEVPTERIPLEKTEVLQTTTQEIEPTQPPPTPTEEIPPEPIYPEMALVEAGSFRMGSDEGPDYEGPVHTVSLTKPFEIGVYTVTFDEYDRYCEIEGVNYVDDYGQGRGQHPVTGVDWYDASAYCNWLSEQEGLTPCYSSGGRATKCDFSVDGYRLPAEAEWEYAARGGQMSQGYTYAGSDDPDEVGWHAGNSGGAPHPVGELKANELGLFDMSGNHWEWCWDWWDEDYYADSPQVDPTGPSKVPDGNFVERVRRSSSAVEDAATLRTTYRSADGANYPGRNGIRLVRTRL